MEPQKQRISLIAALGTRTRAIGRNNDLLWHLPGDLKRFKELTNGHPVIMGRKTWDSLPEKFRPLPNRTNIVVTRSSAELLEAVVAHSLEGALETARQVTGSEEIFVIGGGELYRQALPLADRLYLTLVEDDADGDVYFPDYPQFTTIIEEENGMQNGLSYTHLTLDRG